MNLNKMLPGTALLCTLFLAGCAPTMLNPGVDTGGPSLDRLSAAQPARGVKANGLVLSSAQFQNGGALGLEQVGSGNGCTGGNLSPALSWTGAPDKTVSYALTAYDPDAPTGSGFWHWIVYNIPASVTGLDTGAGSGTFTLPDGTVQANNDGGAPGYTGACPPSGDSPHHYVFTLYALNKTIELPAGASAAYVGFNLNGATLAKTSIVATYGR
jgi:Raf kinase inhibitor-like YbhB/YbcL family protein